VLIFTLERSRMNWRAFKHTGSNLWRSSKHWIKPSQWLTRRSSQWTRTLPSPSNPCKTPRTSSCVSWTEETHSGLRKSANAKTKTSNRCQWPSNAFRLESMSVRSRFEPTSSKTWNWRIWKLKLRLKRKGLLRFLEPARSVSSATPKSSASSKGSFSVFKLRSRWRSKKWSMHRSGRNNWLALKRPSKNWLSASCLYRWRVRSSTSSRSCNVSNRCTSSSQRIIKSILRWKRAFSFNSSSYSKLSSNKSPPQPKLKLCTLKW